MCCVTPAEGTAQRSWDRRGINTKGLGWLYAQALCVVPSLFIYVTATSSHLIHPFLCVHFEPPFSSYPTRVHGLTFLSLYTYAQLPKASSPSEVSSRQDPVPCPQWEPSPVDPFPIRAPSSGDFVAATAGVPISRGKYFSTPNTSML